MSRSCGKGWRRHKKCFPIRLCRWRTCFSSRLPRLMRRSPGLTGISVRGSGRRTDLRDGGECLCAADGELPPGSRLRRPDRADATAAFDGRQATAWPHHKDGTARLAPLAHSGCDSRCSANASVQGDVGSLAPTDDRANTSPPTKDARKAMNSLLECQLGVPSRMKSNPSPTHICKTFATACLVPSSKAQALWARGGAIAHCRCGRKRRPSSMSGLSAVRPCRHFPYRISNLRHDGVRTPWAEQTVAARSVLNVSIPWYDAVITRG